MKKLLYMALAVMLSIVMLPVALGEVDAGVMSSFNSNVGAEMRFTQLEYQIGKNLIIGGNALTYVNNSLAEEILVEMSALQADVASVQFNQSNEVLAELFVAYKQEATNLTAAFREEVSTEISDNQRTNIMAVAQRDSQAELRALNEERVALRKAFNKERISTVLGAAGINRSVITTVQAAVENDAQLKSSIRSTMASINSSARAEIAAQLREDKSRGEVLEQRGKERASQRLAEIRMRLHNRILANDVAVNAGISGIMNAESRVESRYENASDEQKGRSMISVRGESRTSTSAQTSDRNGVNISSDTDVTVGIGGRN